MSGHARVATGPLADAVAAVLADDWEGGSTAPAGALLAVSDGSHTSYAAAGRAQGLPGRAPVELAWATRSDAGSVTKAIATTAALMALVDAGQVDLDAPAARYVPALGHRDATVRDLLEHRAGLWEWWPLYLTGATGADAVHRAATMPLRYAPRSGRHYSDLGFILLGQLVVNVAAAPLPEAVRDLAFDRYGLVETRYAAPAPGAAVAASSAGDRIEQEMIRTGVPYPVEGSVGDFPGWRERVLVGEVNDGNAYHAFGGVAGHAGTFTTARDLLAFATGLLRCLAGDGPVRRETAVTFMTPGADATQALGFRVWSGPAGPAIGHTGFPGVAFALLPEQGAAVAMITNRLHTTGSPRPTDEMWDRALTAAARHLADEPKEPAP